MADDVVRLAVDDGRPGADYTFTITVMLEPDPGFDDLIASMFGDVPRLDAVPAVFIPSPLDASQMRAWARARVPGRLGRRRSSRWLRRLWKATDGRARTIVVNLGSGQVIA